MHSRLQAGNTASRRRSNRNSQPAFFRWNWRKKWSPKNIDWVVYYFLWLLVWRHIIIMKTFFIFWPMSIYFVSINIINHSRRRRRIRWARMPQLRRAFRVWKIKQNRHRWSKENDHALKHKKIRWSQNAWLVGVSVPERLKHFGNVLVNLLSLLVSGTSVECGGMQILQYFVNRCLCGCSSANLRDCLVSKTPKKHGNEKYWSRTFPHAPGKFLTPPSRGERADQRWWQFPKMWINLKKKHHMRSRICSQLQILTQKFPRPPSDGRSKNKHTNRQYWYPSWRSFWSESIPLPLREDSDHTPAPQNPLFPRQPLQNLLANDL